MILEILAVILVVLCSNMLSRLICRRRDVFYYLSKSNPHGDVL